MTEPILSGRESSANGASADWPDLMDWPHSRDAMIYAIGYGRLGYPVMPGARFRNMPHKMLGKGWSHKATGPGSTDERQIIGWWLRDPVANIGLQAGRGFVVIDIDTHPGKANGFDSLQAEGIELPDLPGEWTPNGRHLFGRLPEGVTLRGRGWLPGVEIKAMGNFVAVWPSARSYVSTDPKDNGDLIPVQYRRDPGWPCELRDLPVLPEWLLTDIQTRPAVRQTRDGKRVQEDTSLDRLPPTDKFLESGFGWFTGSRTMDCYRLSWRLWNKFRDEDTVFATIVTIYDLTPDVEGFPWKKVFQTVRAVERQWNEKKLADTQLSNGWSARE